MRHALFIALSLLIQIGLVGRVMSAGMCCPGPVLEHHHDLVCDHPSAIHLGTILDPCAAGHDHPGDCGDPHHHHHHGKCIHAVPLTFFEESSSRLAPLAAVAWQCSWHHQLPPEDPVLEQDEPPLI